MHIEPLDIDDRACLYSTMNNASLIGAYALNGPEDCRRLYAEWAQTYDAEFAATMAYRLPVEVAAAYLRADPAPGDVLDVGAGTGLLAAALRGMGFTGAIDAVDLSTEMLNRAKAKGLYRDLIEADITKSIPHKTRYAGIVSSGTFTQGHVGPEALRPLIACAKPGALFVLSVNQAIWDRRGFQAAFDALHAEIAQLSLDAVPIYGEAAKDTDPDHAADRALVVSFRVK